MKFCIVGAGSIGKKHIRNLRQIFLENGEELSIHLLRSGKSTLDVDIKKLIQKEVFETSKLDVYYDAIIITNPTFLHYDTLMELKNYSKNFFVEKPVFESHEKNIDDMELPKDNVYYVACPLRYCSIIEEAIKILEKEKVFSVRAICSTYLPDWRPNVDYRNIYSAKKDEGGGVSIDLIHEWDYISYLFGKPLKIEKICGKYSDLEIDSDDIAIYIAKYKELLVEIHLDYFGRFPQRYFEIYTSGYVYKFDFINSRVYKDGEIIRQFNDEPNYKYLKEMKHFIQIMQGEAINQNDLFHALAVLQMGNK